MISKRKLFSVSICALILITVISCQKSFTGEWVAKIDGDTISIDELNMLYYAQHKHLLNLSEKDIDKYANDPELVKRFPTLNKKIFLEELIKQRLIFNQAKKDGLLDNKEVLAVIQIAKEGAVVQSYVKEKFKDEIKVTEEEVENVFLRERNKRYKGVPIDQAENHIRQTLKGRKLQKKLIELVKDLSEQSRIEKKIEMLNDSNNPTEKSTEEKK